MRGRPDRGWVARPTLAVLLSLTFAQPGASQGADVASDGGRGFFQAGYIGLDLGDLNGDLEGAGFPRLDGTLLTLGGGGLGARGKWLIGGEGHGLIGEDETTADGSRQISVSGGYGLFRVGYLVFTRGGLDLYPTVGVGGGGMTLKIMERSAPTFGDVLTDPDRSSELNTGMFLLDAAISLNYRLVVQDEEAGGGGILVGLQAGYTLAPGNTAWNLDGINSVAGGPTLQIEGFYARVSIGGWGRGDLTRQ